MRKLRKGTYETLDYQKMLINIFVDKKMVPQKWLFLMVRYPGNHEFPEHEKNGLDLDFLLLMSCSFLHEFPFFKIKQHAGNCFTKYLQPREKQFPDKQFLYLLRNHNECCAWILKPLQY